MIINSVGFSRCGKVSRFLTVFGKAQLMAAFVNGFAVFSMSCTAVKAHFGLFLSRYYSDSTYCPVCMIFFRLETVLTILFRRIFSGTRTTVDAAVGCTWLEITSKCRGTAHIYFHSAQWALCLFKRFVHVLLKVFFAFFLIVTTRCCSVLSFSQRLSRQLKRRYLHVLNLYI